MASMNLKHTYTSSEDVVTRCVRRRSAFNIFNKQMMTSNQSTEFARSQMLQRKGLGGTTIFITSEEEANLLGSLSNENNLTINNVTTTSGINYISRCPTVIRKKPVVPLTNKF